jgi:hypothetical protein
VKCHCSDPWPAWRTLPWDHRVHSVHTEHILVVAHNKIALPGFAEVDLVVKEILELDEARG